MPDLLFEIGMEELPAAYGPPALAQLEAKGREFLAAARLEPAGVRALGTPRRLALLATALPERQPDREEWTRGPARSVAFDAEGRPTRAALGFAAAQGVSPADLVVRGSGSGEYVFARRVVPGRPAREVLAEVLPRLVGALEFPRTMRWGSSSLRFARPIRWLVALLGADVVPAELDGLRAGRVSQGHRTLAPGPVTIGSAGEYEEALRRAFVLVDPDARRRAVREGVERVAEGRARVAEDLLEEVTWLVEWPTAFLGRFAESALVLPEDVLVTVMRVHQRYFPVEGPGGRLAPAFVGVRNGGDRRLASVVAGNERVLRARLADARFFYDEDRRRPLAARVPELAQVAFAEGLGTLLDKTERVRRLAGWLAERVGADAAVVDRAAYLAKADRVTHLVYEFPELEGTMGGHYATLDGEPAAVAAAVREHVLPRWAGDALPATEPGRVLAVADRADTLAGQFAVGRAPRGSADPFGLRRAAAGLLRIIADAGWTVSLEGLVRQAAEAHGGAGAVPALLEFLSARLRGLLEEAGFRYDVVDAVLALGPDDAWRRAAALQALVAGPAFDDVFTAYRRAANLAKDAPRDRVAPELFRDPAEEGLYRELVAAEEAVRRLPPGDFDGFYAVCRRLRPPVDAFLAAVLVMADDPAVRRNRLALLGRVADLVGRVADLSRIVAA